MGFRIALIIGLTLALAYYMTKSFGKFKENKVGHSYFSAINQEKEISKLKPFHILQNSIAFLGFFGFDFKEN